MARPLGPVSEHGTRQRYQLRGDPCRCGSCKAANRSYVTGRRLARRHLSAVPAWTQPAIPDELIPKPVMVGCSHSMMDGRNTCSWCGKSLAA